METSQLTCRANQLNSFSMLETVVKWIEKWFYKLGSNEGPLKNMNFIFNLTLIACIVQTLFRLFYFIKPLTAKLMASLAVLSYMDMATDIYWY